MLMFPLFSLLLPISDLNRLLYFFTLIHCFKLTSLMFPVSVEGIISVGIPYPCSAYRHLTGLPKYIFVLEFHAKLPKIVPITLYTGVFGKHKRILTNQMGTIWAITLARMYGFLHNF